VRDSPAEQQAVLACGGCAALVRCLRSDSSAVRKQAVLAVFNMATRSDESVTTALVAAGALPALVHALRGGGSADALLAECIMVAFWHVANASSSFHPGMVAAGAIPAAVQQLSSRSTSVQRAATAMLSILAGSETASCAAAITAAGAIPALVQLLSRSTDSCVQTNAATGLGKCLGACVLGCVRGCLPA